MDDLSHLWVLLTQRMEVVGKPPETDSTRGGVLDYKDRD